MKARLPCFTDEVARSSKTRRTNSTPACTAAHTRSNSGGKTAKSLRSRPKRRLLTGEHESGGIIIDVLEHVHVCISGAFRSAQRRVHAYVCASSRHGAPTAKCGDAHAVPCARSKISSLKMVRSLYRSELQTSF